MYPGTGLLPEFLRRLPGTAPGVDLQLQPRRGLEQLDSDTIPRLEQGSSIHCTKGDPDLRPTTVGRQTGRSWPLPKKDILSTDPNPQANSACATWTESAVLSGSKGGKTGVYYDRLMHVYRGGFEVHPHRSGVDLNEATIPTSRFDRLGPVGGCSGSARLAGVLNNRCRLARGRLHMPVSARSPWRGQ